MTIFKYCGNRLFFALLLFALAAYGQAQKRIAILQTVDDGDSPVEFTDLNYLTKRLREISEEVLQSRYGIMSEQSIIDKLGSRENAAKTCKEASCLAVIGRKINADYIVQARLGRFGQNLTISVELYNSGNGLQVGTISGEAEDVYGLRDILNEKAPELFRKMPGVPKEKTLSSSSSKEKNNSSSSKSNDFLERAITFAVRGDYDMAIEDFTEALKLQPNNGAIYTLRGRAYVAKASKKVVSETDDFSEITVWTFDTLTPKLVKIYEQAINDFTKAIKLEPNNAVNYRERGRAYSYKKYHDKAVADHNQEIRLNLNDAKAYAARGNTYHNKGDYDKAIADFNQVIQLDPNNALAYAWRGYVYEQEDDYDNAIEDYSQVIELKPNDIDAYRRRSVVYMFKNDHENRIADCSQIIRLKPNDTEGYGCRGFGYYDIGDYDRAIEDFSRWIKLKPDYISYRARGEAYANKGDYNKAIADYNQALKLDPNDEWIRNNLESARRAKMAR